MILHWASYDTRNNSSAETCVVIFKGASLFRSSALEYKEYYQAYEPRAG